MLRAAFKYAYPNSKTRALRGTRLSKKDFYYLIRAKDVHAFLNYLAATSYARYLPEHPTKAKTEIPRHLERALSRPLLEDYFRLYKALRKKDSAGLIKALFARFEAENLKIVLRAKFSGLERHGVEHLLYPLPPLSRLQWQTLWASARVKDVVNQLSHTIYGRPLQNALPQFEAQARTFPLEMALDITAYENIAIAVRRLKGRRDRRAAASLIGYFIDMQNIFLVVRLRFTYGLSPEEAVNYSLPGGFIIDIKRLHDIARAEDMAHFVSLLPRPFKTAVKDSFEIRDIQARLHDWFLKLLQGNFLGTPFHLGVEIAYLFEKELELKALISLYQAKKEGLPASQAERLVPSHFLPTEHEHV